MIRPLDYSICEPEILPAASFLAVQYWQTLFLLHKNALLINSQVVGTLIYHVEAKPDVPRI